MGQNTSEEAPGHDSSDCNLGNEVRGLGLRGFELAGGAVLGFGRGLEDPERGLEGPGRGLETSEHGLGGFENG